MSHDANDTPREIDRTTASLVADAMHALSTPSRVQILGQLRCAPRHVSELAQLVDMEQSAVSHQLRVLRTLGLVTSARSGRTTVYALHDEHVAALIDQALHHATHRALGLSDPVEKPNQTRKPAISLSSTAGRPATR